MKINAEHCLQNVAICFVTILLFGCGPGVKDGKRHIVEGYYFSHASKQSTRITRRDSDISAIVIQSRVNGYALINKLLIVSRTPIVYVKTNNVLIEEVTDICEYYTIDVVTHEVLGPINTTQKNSILGSLEGDIIDELQPTICQIL